MKLSTTARLSMLWTSISRVGIQALQLLTFVVVARWLSPAEYGTFAVVMLVVALATLFNDFGLQAALVHDPQPSASKLATAFWLNLAVGAASSALIAMLAYPIELLLDYPTLGLALAVAGLSFLLTVTAVPAAILQRRLHLGRLAAYEFSANLLGASASIYLAWRGLGVLSLAIGPVVTAFTLSVALTAGTRFLPRVRPTVSDLRSLWDFSGSLLGFNITNYAFRNIDTVALTVVSTPQQVGYYSRAYSLISAPVTQAGAVIGRVLFPILARSRDDLELFRNRWLRATYASFGLLLPVCIAFAVTSPYVIGLLFEPRWYPMAAIISVLAIAAPVRLLSAALGPVYQATGHTKELLRVTLLQGILLTIGVIAGAAWGPIGVAWGVAIASNISSYIPLSVGLRYMDMTVLDLTIEVRWILVAGLAQLIAMFGVRLAGGFGSDIASLFGCLGVGLTCYIAIGWVFDRDFFRRLIGRATSQ